MNPNHQLPLQCFHDVSLTEKAKAIERWGVALTNAELLGMRFMLYAMNGYFAEVTICGATCEILSIKATVEPNVMDLYLESININELKRLLQFPNN